jgi:TFIIF-interacting CTD phosphatase-like protein
MFNKLLRSNVILDLDETLIRSFPMSIVNDNLKDIDSTLEYFDFVDIRVYARPYLKEFIEFLSTNYNISIWTAATHEYAIEVVKHFIEPYMVQKQKVDLFFYRYQTEIAFEKFGGWKDLRYIFDLYKPLGVNRNNTIIIDDNHVVMKTNGPNNCINIRPWMLEPHDIELLRVGQLIEQLLPYRDGKI